MQVGNYLCTYQARPFVWKRLIIITLQNNIYDGVITMCTAITQFLTSTKFYAILKE